MQQESETTREQILSLEEQLQGERQHKDDAEMEVSKQKQVGALTPVYTDISYKHSQSSLMMYSH